MNNTNSEATAPEVDYEAEETAETDEMADELLAGWDDEGDGNADEQTSENAAGAEEGSAEEAEANGEADQQTETEAKDTDNEAENKDEKPEEADQLFELKHLDEVKNVNREEVIALAQKGMDYDRIRAKLDEKTATDTARDEFLEELATNAGVTVPELMNNVRATILINKAEDEGKTLSMEDALNRVKLAQIEKETQRAQQKALDEQKEKDLEEQKRQATLSKFAKTYPGVKGDEIPKEIWDSFFKGEGDLTDLYTARVLFPNLQKENSDLKQAEKNRKASTGSRKTVGSAASLPDPDFVGWDD